MESTKPSYSAILSRDKDDVTPQRSDVHVNDRVHRPCPEPVKTKREETRTRRREAEDRDREHLQHLYNEKLRGHRDALVLDGARLRAPTVRLVEAQEILPVPGSVDRGETRNQGSKMAQAPTRQPRKEDREVREETRGGAQPKELPGSRWGDAQRALILKRCNSELRVSYLLEFPLVFLDPLLDVVELMLVPLCFLGCALLLRRWSRAPAEPPELPPSEQ